MTKIFPGDEFTYELSCKSIYKFKILNIEKLDCKIINLETIEWTCLKKGISCTNCTKCVEDNKSREIFYSSDFITYSHGKRILIEKL